MKCIYYRENNDLFMRPLINYVAETLSFTAFKLN